MPPAKSKTSKKIDTPKAVATLDPEPEIIGIRAMRAKKIARAAVAVAGGEMTLAEAGQELYPKANYPRQTVYRGIQQPSVQAELRKTAEIFDEKFLLNELREGIEETREKRSIQAKFLELGLKTKGMLTDKVETKTQNVADLSHVPTDQLTQALLDRLRVASRGPSETGPEAEPMTIGQKEQ